MYVESLIQLCCIKLASTSFQISVKRVHCIQNEVMFNDLLFCKLKEN